jgi:glycosyltransferase involved in cell wall biosynthesis
MPVRGTDGVDSRFRLLVASSDKFPPTRVDVAVLFGEELAERGHHIDWILQSEAQCDRSYQQPWGGGCAYIGPTDLGTSLLSRVRKHLRSVRHDCMILSKARSGNYDIIEVKDKFIAGVLGVVAARLFRTKFIFWLSWPYPEEYLTRARDGSARYPVLYWVRGTTFKFILYRLLLPAADRIFLQSAQMRTDVIEKDGPAEKIVVVPMGVKLSAFEQLRNSPGQRVIPENERCFLYLGTLVKVRRLDFLIRVLARVRRQVTDAKLYLIGAGEDDSDEALLHDEAARLGLQSSVIFKGRLPWAEAQKYVRDADVCVSPFYPTPILNSTSPTKLIEYLAMGRPVVANDHPEQELIIRESGAGYCVPWEEEAFSEAIVALIENPEAARAMGDRGPAYVARHRSYKVIADVVEKEMLNIAHDKAG